ncbi:hypothetical protein [Nonomuraea sp. NPDC050643]|uniref:hypothetical protein n=1 Tax=Nonomuraea sp. NPDC050643 TaxID=3155660 RepID=UPI0033FC203A
MRPVGYEGGAASGPDLTPAIDHRERFEVLDDARSPEYFAGHAALLLVRVATEPREWPALIEERSARRRRLAGLIARCAGW